MSGPKTPSAPNTSAFLSAVEKIEELIDMFGRDAVQEVFDELDQPDPIKQFLLRLKDGEISHA